MSHPYAIDRRMPRAQRTAFIDFAADPGKTVNECHSMVKGMGFNISRTAVANYVRQLREHGTFQFGDFPATPLGMRRAIAGISRRLEGDDLRSLALFAKFIETISKRVREKTS